MNRDLFVLHHVHALRIADRVIHHDVAFRDRGGGTGGLRFVSGIGQNSTYERKSHCHGYLRHVVVRIDLEIAPNIKTETAAVGGFE